MGRTILTHVGTSVLECKALTGAGVHGVDGLQQQALTNLRANKSIANQVSQLAAIFKSGLERYWTERASGAERRRAVAGEISSLSLLRPEADDRVVLVHSDTDQGRLCAALLQEILTLDAGFGFPRCEAETMQIDGLKVPGESTGVGQQDRDEFVRTGLVRYVETVWSVFEDMLEEDHLRLVFNITGGYKGMIPVARDLALILTDMYRDIAQAQSDIRLCYLFEGSDELIWYDSYPISLNPAPIRQRQGNVHDPMWLVLERIVALRDELRAL